MKTSDNRLLVLGLSVAAIAVIALAVFLGIIPLLSAAEAAQGREREVSAQNALLESDIARLTALAETKDEDEARLRELRIALPEDDAQAEFLREIDAAATASGVALRGYSFSSPTGYAIDPPIDERLGSGNYFSSAVQIEFAGPRTAVFDLIQRLQTSKRLFVVGSLSVTVDSASEGATVDAFDAAAESVVTVSGETFMLVSGAEPVFVAPAPGAEPATTEGGAEGDGAAETAE